jgi:hypothetical protein
MALDSVIQIAVNEHARYQQRIAADPTRKAQFVDQMKRAINAAIEPALNLAPVMAADANKSGDRDAIARVARRSGDLRDLSAALSGVREDGTGLAALTSLAAAHARILERQAQREEAGPDTRPALPQG